MGQNGSTLCFPCHKKEYLLNKPKKENTNKKTRKEIYKTDNSLQKLRDLHSNKK